MSEAALDEQAKINIPEWTVSELSAALRRTVEDHFGYVRVRGEIWGFRGIHSSGHCYFALKDETAKIDAVVWRSALARMRFKPEEGMEVIATGRLTTYPGRSSYQIIVESLQPAGVGALMALLEERKKKLAAEGLFDEARKQLLPYLPQVIGVVTSPAGAVIRDILHRLADRFPRHVMVWPVRVQGDGAAEEVAAAIRGFNLLPEEGEFRRPDLIIVARGGGSIEDLWAFNEEIVVRAAAESFVPLISAVGHETDVTLIDFAADRRAPTPTAAAEMAVPVRSELLAGLVTLGQRQIGAWLRCMEKRRTELRSAERALQKPEQIFEIRRQALDGLAERLPRALHGNARLHHLALSRVASRLFPQMLLGTVVRRRERYAACSARLASAWRANLQAHHSLNVARRERVQVLFARAERATGQLLMQRAARVERTGRVLAALSYRGVLERGFALVRDRKGKPVRSASAVTPNARLDIEFADGHVSAMTEARPAPVASAPAEQTSKEQPSKEKASNPARPLPKSFDPKGQGSLF